MKRRDIVISALACVVAPLAKAGDPKAAPPDGALGIRWLSAPPKGWAQVGRTTKDGFSIYTRASPPPVWEGVPIREESLQFDRSKLYGATLYFNGEPAHQTMLDALQRLYGRPTFTNEAKTLHKWAWSAAKTSIVLSFRKPRAEGMLSITRD